MATTELLSILTNIKFTQTLKINLFQKPSLELRDFLFLSFGLHLDNKLKNSIKCFIKYQKECQIEVGFYRILQYFLLLITGFTIFFYSLEIGAKPRISLLLTVVSLLIISHILSITDQVSHLQSHYLEFSPYH